MAVLFVVVDLHQHRHVVRAVRDHRHLAAPRLPAVVLGHVHARRSGTSRPWSGSFGLFFTLFCLFVRFLPMVATAEVKTVLPQAARSPGADGARGAPDGSRAGGGGRLLMAPAQPRAAARRDLRLLAEFASPSDLYHACERVRDAGYTRWDAHSPFPVHGLDRAMGLGRSRLPCVTLVCGLSGALGGLRPADLGQRLAYPLVISGKPLFAWPPYVPITFELGVLLAALSARRRHAGVQPAAHAPPSAVQLARLRAGDRRRLLHLDRVVGSEFDAIETERFLRQLGATHVELGGRRDAPKSGRSATSLQDGGSVSHVSGREPRPAGRAGRHGARARPWLGAALGVGGLAASLALGADADAPVLLLVARRVPLLPEHRARQPVLRPGPVRLPRRVERRAAPRRRERHGDAARVRRCSSSRSGRASRAVRLDRRRRRGREPRPARPAPLPQRAVLPDPRPGLLRRVERARRLLLAPVAAAGRQRRRADHPPAAEGRRPRDHRLRAHPDVRVDRLDHVARPRLVLDDVRRLLFLRRGAGVLRVPDPRHRGRSRPAGRCAGW